MELSVVARSNFDVVKAEVGASRTNVGRDTGTDHDTTSQGLRIDSANHSKHAVRIDHGKTSQS